MRSHKANGASKTALLFVFAFIFSLSCAQPKSGETTRSGSEKPGHSPLQTGQRDEPSRKTDVGQPSPQVEEKWFRYRLRTDPAVNTAFVTICFEGFSPKKLVPGDEAFAKFFVEGWHIHQGEKAGSLSLQDGKIAFAHAKPGDCAEIVVDLQEAALALQDWRQARRVDKDFVSDPSLWRWRPERIPRDSRARISFDLPPGVYISHPWTRARDGSYVLPWHAFDWPSIMAIGPTKPFEVRVPGGVLHTILLGQAPLREREIAKSWVSQSALAVSSLYGRFPQRDTQVLMLPVGPAGGSIVFGMVMRGGGMGVHLLVGQPLDAEALRTDWITVHELSHLFLPFTIRREIWFSEGVATYYQNVLRSRAKMMSPEEAWKKLQTGFLLGNNGYRGRSLVEATEVMDREGNYLRVYWGGTAMVFAADIELRRRSKNTQSLDTALKALGDCCLAPPRYYSVEELLAKLDSLTEGTTFSRLYNELAFEPVFPLFEETWKWLGIDFSDNQVVFDQDAPGATIRESIMRGPE